MSLRAYLFWIASMSCACASSPAAAPSPVVAPSAGAHQPELEHTFVSTSNNDAAPTTKAASVTATSDFVVTTPEAAKQLAESAVADRLDPLKTWVTSPLLPATWPVKDRAVVYFFYPLAANPRSMTEFKLSSAAWRVEVSLRDGEAAVTPVAKPRELGTISHTRPSSLERRELEVAEAALVRELVGTEVNAEESPYWGYLKYMHEHPELAKDLQRRSPSFLAWVRKRYGK